MAEYVLVTVFESSVMPDGNGIVVPGHGEIGIGDQMRGTGGILERPPDGFAFCSKNEKTDFVSFT